MFLFKNKHQFPVNTEIHHHATRQQSNFHQPPAHLTKYQKGICYLGIKVFNKLPPYIKDEFENIRRFKRRLKNFCMKGPSTHYRSTLIWEIKKSKSMVLCIQTQISPTNGTTHHPIFTIYIVLYYIIFEIMANDTANCVVLILCILNLK